uniref:Parvin, gamma n=1 Tax=Cynoglossus semilaevis TaxID=244447 RepID=A0A3P8VL18_CYNSE
MMEAGMFEYNKEEQSVDLDFFQGEKRKIIQPASLKDPKFEDLKQALVDWINDTLKREHIVVQSLEEDMYDGLILHHLLVKLADAQLSVADIALTAAAQMHKLELVLEELDKRLGLQDSSQSKWNVKLIHNKDLLATVHLLVAMVRRFQPELNLPSNVKVEVVTVEVSSSGIKSVIQTEELTGNNSSESLSDSGRGDPIEELLKLEAYKVNTVKKV